MGFRANALKYRAVRLSVVHGRLNFPILWRLVHPPEGYTFAGGTPDFVAFTESGSVATA